VYNVARDDQVTLTLYTNSEKSFVLIFVVFIDNFSPKLKSVTKPKQALQVIWDIK